MPNEILDRALAAAPARLAAAALGILLDGGDTTSAVRALATLDAADLTPTERTELAGRLVTAAARSGAAERAELLSAAARIDPAVGLAPLARLRARSGDDEGALTAWSQLAALPGAPLEAALALAGSAAAAGDSAGAVAHLLAGYEARPGARSALALAPRLGGLPGDRRLRVALLGTATLDQLAATLTVEARRFGVTVDAWMAPFGQYAQQVLDPTSELYARRPDVIVLALHASRLFPLIHGGAIDSTPEDRRRDLDAGLAQVESLVAAIRRTSSALILVHGPVLPRQPAAGIQDRAREAGQRELLAEAAARLASLFRERFEDVHLVDEDAVQSLSGKARATDVRMWLTARLPWSDAALVGLAREHLRYLLPRAGAARKLVVVDLDNTLWGGVLGEDGVAGLRLGEDAPGNAFRLLQAELERLWRRGILLAVASKNDDADAISAIDGHPAMLLRSAHFAARRIGWQPKAQSIREIAAELNLGLDAVVFLDDNPLERALVRAELPMVLVPELPAEPALYREALLELPVFESLSLTADDLDRNRRYAARAERTRLAGTGPAGDLESHLAQLGIVVELAPVTEASLARAAQMTQKTNQMNVTTRRYGAAEVRALAERGIALTASVSDRVGDDGITALAIALPGTEGEWEVDTLLLSCRVMGRGVEAALAAALLEAVTAAGGTRLRGRFIPTAKNAPAADLFARLGFTPAGDGEWVAGTDHSVPVPAWITVRDAGPDARRTNVA